ncbi:MAG: alpha-(1-_3)-arabinofuranosyltransferase domain-containing protein [Acidimicrobiales bacterium]
MPPETSRPQPGGPRFRLPPASSLASWAVLAVLSYLPLFTSKPGMVAADTKAYLYLDPGRLTQSAASMWDPSVGMGTVTHQNIGYLFPMGPFFWAVHALGIPMWIGQRIWMGSLLFAAGTGLWWCSRHLGLTGAARLVAAVAYTATPFIIDYIARISAILMPWAALGWMLGLVILAVRRGGWRYPALFALVVAVVGGVNATSILLAGLAPALWVLYAIWVTREIPLGAAWAALWRIAVLSLAVSLWWIAGLWAEGSYGLAILQYTETVQTVARTSLASEALRGLGYWFFYGQDKVQPWTTAAVPYMQSLWLLGVSFAVPAFSMFMGLLARWRYRAFAIGLVLVGTAVAVGTYPFADPSPAGRALEAASSGSSIGLAMRSSNRVVPIIVMGLALLLGAGVGALLKGRPRLGVLAGVAGVGLVLAGMPPLWDGGLVAANLARPSGIPSYWTQAASYLDAQGNATRVLGLPGEDFAAYRWGVTEDPIPPGLMTRPYVARQVVPQGEPGSVDLMAALDGSIQNGVFDPNGLAGVARLISAGDILIQNDLQYERYALPQPKAFWAQLTPAPKGTALAATFGTPAPTPVIKFPLVDETSLALPDGTPYPPPLAVLSVPGARPITRAESATAPLVLAGNGQGIVDAADAGLLGGNPTVLYSASFDQDPAGFARLMNKGAVLVLTDTNASQGHRWGGLQNNYGYVEQPGEKPLEADPSDARLPVFPRSAADAQTTTDQVGVKSVQATRYGNPVTFTPEDRPANAFDGNPATAWTVDAFSDPVNERLQAELSTPVTTDHIVLLQPQVGHPNRHITRVRLTFDGRRSMTVALGAASLVEPGQTVRFSSRTFSTLDITILGTNNQGGRNHSLDGLSGVGFAEVGIPGVNLQEVIDMPGDLLRLAGPASQSHQLVVLMDRNRAPDTPPRTDPELDMVRGFSLPTSRTFTVGGQARISAKDSDALIDFDIGSPGPVVAGGRSTAGVSADPVVSANSSTRLPGDRYARADAAVDGNPDTSWSAALAPQDGEWLQYNLARPLSFGHLDMQVVNDGRHSLPTSITVSAGAVSRTVSLPALAVGMGRPQGAVSPVDVSFPTLRGSTVRITLDTVHQLTTLDYYGGQSGNTDVLPVALAEVGLPGVSIAPPPARIPSVCHTHLLTIDGRPIDIRISGTSAAALAGRPLAITPCGNSAGGIRLAPGSHTVHTSPRLPSGFEVDQLWLGSAAGGGALRTGAAGAGTPGAGALPAVPTGPAPAVTVTHQSRTQETVSVHGKGQGFWLILGESLSRGWRASIRPAGGGPAHSLGAPTLIDGYANGWYVPASLAGPALVAQIDWAPQRVVWVALGLSAAGLLACAALALVPLRRRRSAQPAQPAESVESVESVEPVLGTPLSFDGSRPAWPRALAWALGAGVAAGVLTAPLAAPVVAGMVLLGLLVPYGRLLLGGAAVGLVMATAGYMIDAQWFHRYLSNIDWPGNFPVANSLGWAAVILLAADALVELVRRRAGIDQPA